MSNTRGFFKINPISNRKHLNQNSSDVCFIDENETNETNDKNEKETFSR